MNISLWNQAVNIEDRMDGYEEPGPRRELGDTPRAHDLGALLEKSKSGLLAPSEVGRLGVIVERALVLIGEERGYTRLRGLDWLANDDEDWTP